MRETAESTHRRMQFKNYCFSTDVVLKYLGNGFVREYVVRRTYR